MGMRICVCFFVYPTYIYHKDSFLFFWSLPFCFIFCTFLISSLFTNSFSPFLVEIFCVCSCQQQQRQVIIYLLVYIISHMLYIKCAWFFSHSLLSRMQHNITGPNCQDRTLFGIGVFFGTVVCGICLFHHVSRDWTAFFVVLFFLSFQKI